MDVDGLAAEVEHTADNAIGWRARPARSRSASRATTPSAS